MEERELNKFNPKFLLESSEQNPQGENKERILRKTITYEAIEKPFTTEKKRKSTINISRKGSIVKEKCRQLSEISLNLFPDRHLSDQDLTDLIQRYVGGDKETLRAYKGYMGQIKRRSSGEGYIVGQSRKGYLELLDFMHRVSRMEWVIHAQMKLPNSDLELHNNEGLEFESIDKISISPILQGKECEKTVLEVVSPNKETIEKQYNNNNTERERNFRSKDYASKHTVSILEGGS